MKLNTLKIQLLVTGIYLHYYLLQYIDNFFLLGFHDKFIFSCNKLRINKSYICLMLVENKMLLLFHVDFLFQ